MSSTESVAEQLMWARLMFAQVTLQVMSYGLYVVLSIMGIQVLLRRHTQQRITLYYSVFMLVLTTAWFVTTSIANEVVQVEMPIGGVSSDAEQCAPVNVAATALSTLQFIFSDLLLLYRAFVIWDRRPAIIALPALTWLTFVGIVIVANMPCTTAVINYTPVYTAYYALSVCTNALCTILICTRIILHRREIRGAGIAADTEYAFLTSTMAESGAWYAIAGLINIALYVKNVPFGQITNTIFSCLAFLTQAQVILRVALGVDYQGAVSAGRGEDAHKVSTAMAFNSVFGRNTTGTDTTAGNEGSDVWEMSNSGEKDVERGSVGSASASARRTIPSANRL